MKPKSTSTHVTAEPSTESKRPFSARRRLLSCGLVLLCVLLALLLAAFIAVSAVVMESHTYKRAAKNEAYLAGVENEVIDIMKETAKEEGLSKTMLLRHVQSDEIRKLAKQNAADATLVLKGSQVIYGHSFNEAALQTDLYKFYERRLPEKEPVPENSSVVSDKNITSEESSTTQDETAGTSNGSGDANAQASGGTGLFSKTEEDPEREELREECDKLAAEISVRIDAAVRVIDMEKVAYDASKGGMLDWFRFMGRGGVLLPLLLLALGLLVLYRLTWQRGFSPWLAGVAICSGSALLVCAALIPAGGWLNLSIEPVQLAILCETIFKGILAELIVMTLLWFIIGYIAIRAAIGKPVSTKRLRALFAKLRPAAGNTSGDASADRSENTTSATSPDNSTPVDAENVENTTLSAESSIDDEPFGPTATSDNAALLQTIKKAAVDSTNALLGRKKR